MKKVPVPYNFTPGRDANNYMIDMTMDNKGTRMMLQEERRTNANTPGTADTPAVSFESMTDTQVRDHILMFRSKSRRVKTLNSIYTF